MKPETVGSCLFIIAAFLFDGCMMGARMGMMMHEAGDAHHQEGHVTPKEFVKEATYNGYHVSVTFPALELHNSSMLHIVIDSSGNPGHGKIKLRIVQMREKENDKIVIDEFVDLAINGTLEYPFTPHENAPFHFEFTISRLGSESLEIPIVLSATVSLKHQKHEPSSGTSTRSRMIIGGIIMGTMMIAMMAWRIL